MPTSSPHRANSTSDRPDFMKNKYINQLNSLLIELANKIVGVLPNNLFFRFKRALYRTLGMKIGNKVLIASSVTLRRKNIHIGNNTWINSETMIVSSNQASVIIGNDCEFAPRVLITTETHRTGLSNHRAGNPYSEGVVIGDGSWVGANATILAGVTIGRGCIIAAGAVVCKDVEDNTLVGGVPAKKIKELNPPNT